MKVLQSFSFFKVWNGYMNVWISIKGFTIFRVWIYNYLKHSTNCVDLIFSIFSQSLTHCEKTQLAEIMSGNFLLLETF